VDAGAYTKLLRSPGVPRLAFAYLALGLAYTMTPVAFVLFARAATRSYAVASLVLAAATAGGVLSGPIRGRLVDRLGPTDAVLRLVLPDIATDIAFIAAGRGHASAALLVGLGFIAGAVSAPGGAAVRSVWSQTLSETETRHAGYAAMTVIAETTYIAGPLLAGGLIALVSPTAAVATIAVLSFVGAVAFATAPGTRARRPVPPVPGRLPALGGAGIRTVVATAAGFGLTFGILDVAFPAFAREHGSTAGAGILLSAFAVGSLIAGFAYGLRPNRTLAGRRYPRLCLLAAAGLAPLILTPGLAAMAALALLSGLCFAPITTCQTAVIDEVTEPAHRAEAFTWLGTVYGTGLAAGAVIAGQLISASGARAAIAAACAATVLAWLLTVARAQSLVPTGPDQAASGPG
jgi:MFS family permease